MLLLVGGRGSLRGRGRGTANAVPPNVRKAPAPDIHLDSVSDFPVLGGSETSPTSSLGIKSETNGKTSPVRGSGERRMSLSFARVVAPAPPSSLAETHDPLELSRSNPATLSIVTSSGSSMRGSAATSCSASDDNPSSPPSSSSSEPLGLSQAPLDQPQSMGQQHNHFERSPPLPTPGPGLTPLQLAFIAANNLSVEAYPRLANMMAQICRITFLYRPCLTILVYLVR